jgi:serine protease SohB
MFAASMDLTFFALKVFIVLCMILIFIGGLIAILARGKGQTNTKISIKHLNEKLATYKQDLLEAITKPKDFKKYLKAKKTAEKEKKSATAPQKNIFLLRFDGDMKASGVDALREEVTAVLEIITPQDEVVVCLESPGGVVHGYGLAAAQLMRIRDQQIPLTVLVDKVAASGGYLMAAVANRIIAAPFAIIGSIGVIFQMPNFHRLLQDKHIDFEQVTAGSYKRTLTLFGQNTEEGREKLHQEIEAIHHIFKNLVSQYRPTLEIDKVATGEHWLATQALELNLVDALQTSDDFLCQQSKQADIYYVSYKEKKSLAKKLLASTKLFKENFHKVDGYQF